MRIYIHILFMYICIYVLIYLYIYHVKKHTTCICEEAYHSHVLMNLVTHMKVVEDCYVSGGQSGISMHDGGDLTLRRSGIICRTYMYDIYMWVYIHVYAYICICVYV